jgi:hypothetical protein
MNSVRISRLLSESPAGEYDVAVLMTKRIRRYADMVSFWKLGRLSLPARQKATISKRNWRSVPPAGLEAGGEI